jgi:GTP cyclohydrolase I
MALSHIFPFPGIVVVVEIIATTVIGMSKIIAVVLE